MNPWLAGLLARKLLACWQNVAGMLARNDEWLHFHGSTHCWHVLLALLARVAGIAGTYYRHNHVDTVAGIAGIVAGAADHQLAGMLAQSCWHAGTKVAGMQAQLLACRQH